MIWDYTKTEYQKQADADPAWHLEHLIQRGPEGEKIDRELLKKYFPKLRIPENRRVFLELLLWNKPL